MSKRRPKRDKGKKDPVTRIKNAPKLPKPGKSSGSLVRCHESHPQLPIKVGETTYHITGGSCTSGDAPGFDVFIGLDHGMKLTSRSFPWAPGTEFKYPITDMSVPQNVDNFKALIAYIATCLTDGKSVFVGCIGGHGRTGLVLSALVNHMTGMKDATSYVRKKYCIKAVESKKQVDFLEEHYGIKRVEGHKENYSTKSWNKGHDYGGTGWGSSSTYHDPGTTVSYMGRDRDEVVRPMEANWHLHGNNKTTTI